MKTALIGKYKNSKEEKLEIHRIDVWIKRTNTALTIVWKLLNNHM